MFSFMKTHHRRWTSSPTSPQSSTVLPQPSPVQASDAAAYGPPPTLRVDEDSSSSSPVSPFPPTLPPIPRVASRQDSHQEASYEQQDVDHRKMSQSWEVRIHNGPEAGCSRSFIHLKSGPFGQEPSAVSEIDGLGDSGPVRPVTSSADTYNNLLSNENGSQVHSSYPPHLTAPSARQFSLPVRNHHAIMTAAPVVHRPALPKPSQSSTSLQSSKPGKGKLNLLNPMSLLMRRRSAQAVDYLADQALIAKRNNMPLMDLPANYDPSIKGKGIHDFSAPRTRRNLSYSDVGVIPPDLKRFEGHSSGSAENEKPISDGQANTRRTGKRYRPSFHEHFGDGVEQGQKNGEIDAEALADTSFIARNESSIAAQDSSSLPPFARRLLMEPGLAQPEYGASLEQEKTLPGLTTLHEVSPPCSPTAAQNLPLQKRASSGRSKVTSDAESSHQVSGLSGRIPSTSSRFSFAGTASAAQERFLEELHRQKAAAKTSAVSEAPRDEDEDEFADDDFCDPEVLDDDIGFEERIPGVNTVIDDEEGSAREFQGQDQYFLPDGRPQITYPMYSYAYSERTHDANHDGGPAIAPAVVGTGLPLQSSLNENETHLEDGSTNYEDDLYFDDGMIADFGEQDGIPIKFDESLLDNEAGPWEQQLLKTTTTDGPYDPDVDSWSQTSRMHDRHHDLQTPSQVHQEVHQVSTNPSIKCSMKIEAIRESESAQDGTVWRTKSDARLHAYHGALANAATKAAADGRFVRQDSALSGDAAIRSRLQDEIQPQQSDVGLAEHHTWLAAEQWSSEVVEEDYEDGLEDDSMVTEANAEALANDDEGFYGQEFGFYAHAYGNKEAVFMSGGYFGPLGVDNVGRKKSIREPLLTPITERSESSMRNSLLSLKGLGLPLAQPLPSPGLSQSAVTQPYSGEDDEWSLEQLMKLRRGAFGGSNGSLTGSHGSPTYNSLIGQSSFQNNYSPSHLHSAMSSDLSSSEHEIDVIEEEASSEASQESDEGSSSPSSPTVTADNGFPVPSPRPKPADFDPSKVVLVAPMKSAFAGRGQHSRKGSGADSVTYVREQDEKGGERWVLERRRTAETGEVEIVEREVVEGGRI